jgi:hypothetical protein
LNFEDACSFIYCRNHFVQKGVTVWGRCHIRYRRCSFIDVVVDYGSATEAGAKPLAVIGLLPFLGPFSPKAASDKIK